jgi:hypothetical protein
VESGGFGEKVTVIEHTRNGRGRVHIQFELEAVRLCRAVGIGCGITILVACRWQGVIAPVVLDLVQFRRDGMVAGYLFGVRAFWTLARCRAGASSNPHRAGARLT